MNSPATKCLFYQNGVVTYIYRLSTEMKTLLWVNLEQVFVFTNAIELMIIHSNDWKNVQY